MYQQPSYSTNVQVGFCGFLILTIVGNGFQTCGELFQAGRAHMDCSSLSLSPLSFFLSLFANLRKDAHWSSPAIYLRQPGNKEQNHAVLAPASSLLQWWEPTWEGRAGGPEPPSNFHHCPCPGVARKFKRVFIYYNKQGITHPSSM